jgi:hypothetical protein
MKCLMHKNVISQTANVLYTPILTLFLKNYYLVSKMMNKAIQYYYSLVLSNPLSVKISKKNCIYTLSRDSKNYSYPSKL